MGSPLLDRLMADIKQAMKDRQGDTLTALRMLHAQVKDATTNAGREPTDDDVISIVSRAIKQRADAVQQFRQGGREDLAAREEAEVALFRRYQPEQLDEAAVSELARKAVAEAGAVSKADTGRVMKLLMPMVKGRADGKWVSRIVASLLP